ncbi:hypothetical protein NKH18_35500 [Streptomyces sp. M10(2022)]
MSTHLAQGADGVPEAAVTPVAQVTGETAVEGVNGATAGPEAGVPHGAGPTEPVARRG